MSDKKICSMCILHSNVPNVVISENGLCQYCETKRRMGNMATADIKTFFRGKMEQIFAELKATPREYDALVMFSGGKDSSYLLNIMKNKYKLNVLAFSMIHPFTLETASQNIDEMAKKLNAEVIKFYMDEEVYRKFMKHSLLEGGKYNLTEFAPCDVCCFFVRWVAIKIAMKFNIPIVMDGNDAAQGGGIKDRMSCRLSTGDWVKPYGKIHDMFDDVFGEAYRYSIYGYNHEELADKTFPYYMTPLSFLEYEPAYSFKELESLGINMQNYKSVHTNCEALYFLDYVAYKKYDCDTYVRQWATGLRNNYNTLEQLELEGAGDNKALSREKMIELLREYKEVLFYVATNGLQADTVSAEHRSRLMELIGTTKEIYGTETIETLLGMILKMNHYADYLEIDIQQL